MAAPVLPAIRKIGGYIVAAAEETPEELALRAMRVLQDTVERQKDRLTRAGIRRVNTPDTIGGPTPPHAHRNRPRQSR